MVRVTLGLIHGKITIKKKNRVRSPVAVVVAVAVALAVALSCMCCRRDANVCLGKLKGG